MVTHWEDQASFEAWRDGAGMAAHATKPGDERKQPVSTGADLLEFEVVLDVKPS